MLKLVIGNRNYSSWSLRAWLYLRASGIEFESSRLPMFTDAWRKQIKTYSEAGRVPVLIDGDVRVWDSLAIILYLRERYPAAVDWPSEHAARAHAMSVTAEMHSGFIAVRGELPQNLRRREALPADALSAGCRAQIGRIVEIWSDARSRYRDRGPWLFGEFSIADVLYVPVALRFRSYEIAVPAPAREFMDAVVKQDMIREWCTAAEAEQERIAFIDDLVPAAESPLTLG